MLTLFTFRLPPRRPEWAVMPWGRGCAPQPQTSRCREQTCGRSCSPNNRTLLWCRSGIAPGISLSPIWEHTSWLLFCHCALPWSSSLGWAWSQHEASGRHRPCTGSSRGAGWSARGASECVLLFQTRAAAVDLKTVLCWTLSFQPVWRGLGGPIWRIMNVLMSPSCPLL